MTTICFGLSLSGWLLTVFALRTTARHVDHLERRLIDQGIEHRNTLDHIQAQLNSEAKRLDKIILAGYADYEASVETLDDLVLRFNRQHRSIASRVRSVERRLGVANFADVHVEPPSGRLFGFVGGEDVGR